MQIINGGSIAWDAIAYGEQNSLNVDYFKNQLQNIGNNLNERVMGYYHDAQQIFHSFTNNDVLRTMRNAMKSASLLFQENIIKTIDTMDEIQNASLQMQRWIMANPVVREMYHQQRCDGYSDTYVDLQPNKIADNHYDYRRVMDGIFVSENNEDKFTIYMEDLHEGDRELILSEQNDILTTWNIIEMFMSQGLKDPTSQYNANL